MAFRFARKGKMSKQLRDIVRDELDDVLELLSGADVDHDAIHDARTSIKKVRAVLRLLREPLGSEYAAEVDRLRRAGRALSSIRDADAALDTLHALQARYRDVLSSTVVRSVERGLESRERQTAARTERIIVRARRSVSDARSTAPLVIDQIAGVTTVLDGARRGYREVVAAMEPLTVDSAAAAFHEWRKRVKDHWYTVRLFEGIHDGARAHVDTIRMLEQWLGDDHDLAVLQVILLEGGDRYGTARSRTVVLGSILRRRTSLRRRALTLGHRSFTQSDETFAKSLGRWWRDR